MSDSERSALESEERGGLTSAAELDKTPPETRYCTSIQHSSTFLFATSRLSGEVYYLLYDDDGGMPSKVAIDPEEPFIGRIRADSVAPPHSPTSMKRCISRVERTPALARADLFADILCDTPLKEGHISILHTDGPGLSPNEPMAIVEAHQSRMGGISLKIEQRTFIGGLPPLRWSIFGSLQWCNLKRRIPTTHR